MPDMITVSLLDKDGNVQYGLNWGIRENRDHNQAYFQLTPDIYRSDFFPVMGFHFLISTDDGKAFICTRAQKGVGSALQTSDNNAFLGEYLRQRLGVSSGQSIEKKDIENYGRSTISISKKAPLLYYMDFSNGKTKINTIYISNSSQIIYYGVPGSGKSHLIDQETQKVLEEQKARIVFHPDYTNADFVGQILPKSQAGEIKYAFMPGPFSIMIKRALRNPDKKYYLIIEEINRGNASAIFGDIFQLLDRDENGWSRYFIENDFLNNYIRNPKEYNDAEYSEMDSEGSIELGGSIHFSANTGIRLPPNLSLLATMNTSDQNVFTLDNAFQRRWEMKLVADELNMADEGEKAQYNAMIEGTGMCWGRFRTQMNTLIAAGSEESGLSSMEDKRLGSWFIKPENAVDSESAGTISAERFAAKVLKYLWDDAFKFNRTEIFSKNFHTFDEVYSDFIKTKKLTEVFAPGKITDGSVQG